MTKAIELIKSLSAEAENLPEIIAPVFGKDGSVSVVIGQHPYRFDVSVNSPNWYILKPESSTKATVVREAEVSEIRKCLNACPKFTVIAVRRLYQQVWLVFPFNLSDANSRGLETVNRCFLIDRKIEPFTVATTRIWGNSLVFDPSRIKPPPREYTDSLERGNSVPPKVKGLNPEFSMVYSMLHAEMQKAKMATTEGKIRSAVEYLGAELIGFTESGEEYVVTWKDGSETHKSRIARDLRLLSTGICLSGLEHEQTLTSTVAVMRHSGNRFGYEDYDD